MLCELFWEVLQYTSSAYVQMVEALIVSRLVCKTLISTLTSTLHEYERISHPSQMEEETTLGTGPLCTSTQNKIISYIQIIIKLTYYAKLAYTFS